MIGRAIGAMLVAVLPPPAFAQRLVAIPTVSCPSDGQLGPQAAPPVSRHVRMPARIGERLAWYAVDDWGVLAPRHWSCLELSGSNGESLIVTPRPYRPNWSQGIRVAGPAVFLSHSNGGTSGRFAAVAAAVGLFPSGPALQRKLAHDGFAPPASPARLSAADRIIARSPARLQYVTPAGHTGLGTRLLAADAVMPIAGTETLVAAGEAYPDLYSLAVRLPARDRDLTATILGRADREIRR